MVAQTRRFSSVKSGRYNRSEQSNETIWTGQQPAPTTRFRPPYHRPAAASYDRSEQSNGSATFAKTAASAPSRDTRTQSRISAKTSVATTPHFDLRQPREASANRTSNDRPNKCNGSLLTPIKSHGKEPVQPSTNQRQTIEPKGAVHGTSETSDASLGVSSSSQSNHQRQGIENAEDTIEIEPLPDEYWKKLEALKFHYPGWERDYTHACEAYHLGEEETFIRSYRKLRDKQRVYNDYKAFSRMSELANLKLTYPGYEADKQALEVWHLKNPSTDAADSIFQDSLEGLRNKEQLFFGNRTHPNIIALDKLDLSYPGWEVDYQTVVSAHCSRPATKFEGAFHRLQEKQRLHDGIRSHWRLVILDRLSKTLTYPGWEDDVAHVEKWHIESIDNNRNGRMFSEVLEGMKDQQQIFLGWNHEGGDESDSGKSNRINISSSDYSLDAQGVFYRLDVESAKDMKKCYDSITSSLQAVEGKRKQLLERRSASPALARRSTSPTFDSSSNESGRDSASSHSDRGWSSQLAPSYPRQSPSSFYQESRSGTPMTRGRTSSFQSRRYNKNASNISLGLSQSGLATTGIGNYRPPPGQTNPGRCVICLDRAKTHVFVPCGHLCVCAACSNETMKTTKCCPICNIESQSSFRVFTA